MNIVSIGEILQYIEEKKKSDIKIHEFLTQFYIDKMLNLKEGKKNVGLCKKIIAESESFSESLSLLGMKKRKDICRSFKKYNKRLLLCCRYRRVEIQRQNSNNYSLFIYIIKYR
uniref:Uncharacterized protein n=1 Tax=Clostridioides difficile TaxID=1496 RepID=A0A381I774_CLODI|nr:Uncharacterised protein [Clostridioides difficile]